MAALGYGAVSLVEAVSPAFILVMSLAAVLSFAANRKNKTVIPTALWNVLALAILAFFIADYIAISESLITSASRFLTILLTLKLFDLKKTRDYMLVFSLVFFQILAAAASTASPVFFIILSLFIIGGIWAMMIFNIRRDWHEARSGEVPAIIFGAPFSISIVIISISTIVITLILFFMLPRVGIGFFDRKTANTIKVTGFSDKVDLGAIGPMKTDSTIVMRVELKGRLPKGILYFRGAALDRYDGKSWNKTARKEYLVSGDENGAYNIARLSGRLIEQNIYLEPLDTDVIFAASTPVRIEGRLGKLWKETSGSIRLQTPPYSRIEYKAWSSEEAFGEDAPSAEYLDTSYLDNNPSGEKIKNLLLEILKDRNTDEVKARSIEKYLKTNFTYSLNPPAADAERPLEEFLFRSKQGYCEHYATAMAMMLREAGIPTRLVTGFIQGEWNSLGNYFIVRQEDAHSWVEAYIDGKGWMRFDPTPPAGISAFRRASNLSLYLDLMKLKWNRYIIHFSFSDQRRLALGLEARTRGLFDRLKSFDLSKTKLDFRFKSFILISAFVASSILILIGFLRRSKKEASKTPVFYLEMLKALKKNGLSKKGSETPLEFAERVGMPEVALITDAFNLQRYGGKQLSNNEMDGVRKAVEALRVGK